MNNYRNNRYQCRNMQCISTFPTEPEPSCDCIPKPCTDTECETCICDKPLAMAYVPWQNWSKVLCASEGLENGTIFPELILPFLGCRPINTNIRRRM